MPACAVEEVVSPLAGYRRPRVVVVERSESAVTNCHRCGPGHSPRNWLAGNFTIYIRASLSPRGVLLLSDCSLCQGPEEPFRLNRRLLPSAGATIKQ